jgi:hypothetical protein
VSSIVAFEPHNTSFSRPAFIAMAYDEAAAEDPNFQLAFFRKVSVLCI